MSRFHEYEQSVGQQIGQLTPEFKTEFEQGKKPLLDSPKPPRLAQPSILRKTSSLARLFSEAIYEFRTSRKELEDGACRLERLGRIGIMVNRMRARNLAMDFGGSDDDDTENTQIDE